MQNHNKPREDTWLSIKSIYLVNEQKSLKLFTYSRRNWILDYNLNFLIKDYPIYCFTYFFKKEYNRNFEYMIVFICLSFLVQSTQRFIYQLTQPQCQLDVNIDFKARSKLPCWLSQAVFFNWESHNLKKQQNFLLFVVLLIMEPIQSRMEHF